MPTSIQRYTINALLTAALISLTFAVFWPGTSGNFQLDDYENLKEMQKYGVIDNLQSFKAFVFSGISGPTGRPVSLASFVLDSRTWPAEPYPFIRSNILIHAVNGIIIFFLVQQLLQLLGATPKRALTLGAISAALWLIHPFHTSTVLYIIQRMTELSALFVLVGIACYLHGRAMLKTKAGPGYVWMSIGIVLFGALATLSKENGILLPLYIAVIEFTLLRNTPKPAHWKHWSLPMLWLPAIAIFVYLAMAAFNHETSYANRDFTLYERLITQPMVLLDYLRRIFVPTTFPTLNYDDFVVAKTLWQPAAFFSAAALLGMLVTGLLFAKRLPVISFAILWFLAGHILESSVLSLEIYFEHRNYLPMLGPLFALAYYADRLIRRWKKPAIIATALVISGFAAISWHHNTVWGDYSRLAKTWAKNQPNSVRAQMTYTLDIFKTRGEKEATARITAFKKQFPDVLGIEILYTEVMCIKNQLTREKVTHFLEALATHPLDIHVQSNLAHLIDSGIKGICRQIGPGGVLAIIDALLNNPAMTPGSSLYASLQFFKYQIYLSTKQVVPALKALDEAFRVHPTIDIALKQAEILINIKQASAARSQLNKAEALDRLRGRFIPSRKEEIEALREKLASTLPGRL